MRDLAPEICRQRVVVEGLCTEPIGEQTIKDYLAELSKAKPGDKLAKESFEAYKTAYWHALTTLEPTHPTRLGLALNFAVYFHAVMKSPERACHLAKHALDEAVAYATDPETAPGNIEDSVMILQLIKDDLLLWHEEMKRDASE